MKAPKFIIPDEEKIVVDSPEDEKTIDISFTAQFVTHQEL